jgi:hypothetical protein
VYLLQRFPSFRAFFIDDVVAHAWKQNVKEALKDQFTEVPDNETEFWIKYRELITKVKRLAINFAYRLLVIYVNEHQLKVSDDRQNKLENQIKNFANPQFNR